MNIRSRALRLVMAATLTVGMTGVGVGFATSASANGGFPSSSPVTPIAGHEVDTGMLVLQFDASQAGLTAAVATPDPADASAVSTITGVIDSDGSVTLRDFAGPASIYLKTSDGQVHQLGSSPLPGTVVTRQAASIFRGETGTYAYSPDTDTFDFVSSTGGIPTPPSAQDVMKQIPITHYVETTQGLTLGDSGYLMYTSFSLNGIGDPNFTTTAVSYAYGSVTQHPGEPDALGGGMIRNGRLGVGVPALYSYGIHQVASFDPYGRLLALTQVGDSTPIAAPAGSSAAAHPQDTGTVIIEVSNVMWGTEITSTVADPTKPGTSSVVSTTLEHGGLVALTNFAGNARIDVAPSGNPGQDAASLSGDVGIYRGQTVLYGYPSVSSTSNDLFSPIGGVTPTPVIPTTPTEAEALTPVATSTVSPTSWPAGSDLPLTFGDVTMTAGAPYDPKTDVPIDSPTVDNYVYDSAASAGSPTSLGSSTIPLTSEYASYSFTVPGTFTSGGTVATSFDQYGRLVALDKLDGEISATPPTTPPSTTPPTTPPSTTPPITPPVTTEPTDPQATTPPATTTQPSSTPTASTTQIPSPSASSVASKALASTGQTGFIPAGIAALVLFGVGAIVLVVSRGRRRASHSGE